jgi:hypothetical protein
MAPHPSRLNDLFTSKNPVDVLKFYKNFNNIEQLINWMRNRPAAKINIIERNGDTDIVVVVLTANNKSKYALNSSKLYKGQKIIFVESSGPYFNYSKSANCGLKYALKFKPKWIILSNDDNFKVDNIRKLKNELKNIKKNDAKVVFASGFSQHSAQSYLSVGKSLLTLYRFMRNNVTREEQIVLNKFGVHVYYQLYIGRLTRLLYWFFFKRLIKFTCTGPFSIFNATFVKDVDGKLFDETYINGIEDVDLSLSLRRYASFIDFSIGTEGGGSLGKNTSRKLRDIANLAYFNYKIAKGDINFE